VIFRDRQRVLPIFCLQHGVTAKAEKFGACLAQSVLIFNQKNGLCPARYALRVCICHFNGRHAIPHARQVNFEHGAHSNFAVGPNKSMILFDDAV